MASLDELQPGAGALGLVERLVGQPEERCRVGSVGRARRDAEARVHPYELVADAPDDFARVVVRRLGEEDRELVAADAERAVALAERPLDRPREHLQRVVARGVAE